MSSVRRPEKALCDDSHLWRVVDDLAHDCPVTPAELDAVEAFLMPLVHALLADASDTQRAARSKDGGDQSRDAHWPAAGPFREERSRVGF